MLIQRVKWLSAKLTSWLILFFLGLAIEYVLENISERYQEAMDCVFPLVTVEISS